ncbi:hypothetical protein SAMN05421644_11530 [Allochromatium warmingii]|uniref:DNA binding domain-containing protein, excisionase family n=1 Tax=Allochromatium warmingii TaxID=61595 RepID=A0A1H3EYC9_ALLWA|nr:hypothetical protein [Allochromatium warmingii]SDX83595.1 hypothetical protein SAMN05421644_11530 [Allochromatium warmingii]
MSRKLVSIRKAADFLGVAAQTLRRYDLARLRSAQLYGSRSRKNRKLLDDVKQAIEAHADRP